jgi:Asp-tRNA(Asn)/Glu-tRNA(Gln) amidotransferase A subunit family amidase
MDRRELLQRAAGGTALLVATEPVVAAARRGDPDGLPNADRLARRGGSLNAFTAVELASLLRYRAASSVEITQACLEQIERHNGPFERLEDNGSVNAFVRVFPEEALAVAKRADRRLSSRSVRSHGRPPPWTGVPVGLKDVLAVKGKPLTVGAPAYRGHVATGDATIVKRVRKALMPMLGHTQAQAYISGISTPQTGNPYELDHIAGGSSGGSAAALAARMVPLTVGGETSGSIISPSLCCGITALKPSHGRVSLYGGWPGIPSVDVFGPMGRTAADCALFLPVIGGEDGHDAHTLAAPALPKRLPLRRKRGSKPLSGLTVGVIENDEFTGPIEAPFAQALERVRRQLASLGARIVAFTRPPSSAYHNARTAEMGGFSSYEVLALGGLYAHQEAELRRLLEHPPGADALDPNHTLNIAGAELSSRLLPLGWWFVAHEVRAAYAEQWYAALRARNVDVVLYLTTGSEVPKRPNAQAVRRTDFGLFNQLGWPAINLPCGLSRDGLPICVQLAAPRFEEPLLLRATIDHQAHFPHDDVPQGFT